MRNHPSKTPRKKKGFTLIELMIVCVIIAGVFGVLLRIAYPSYYTFLARNRVRSTIVKLYTIKKGLQAISSQCRGMPLRQYTGDADNARDEFLKIIDLYECGRSAEPSNMRLTTWPMVDIECVGQSLGKQLSVESINGRNALCRPAVEYGSNDVPLDGRHFSDVFVGVYGEPCTPHYGGGPFNGGSPGWNYRLLTDTALNNPVGVICAVTEGYQTPVKVIINTGGYYNATSVSDGSARFGIGGQNLGSGACSNGPYCEELNTGERGCCSDMGYNF